MVLFIAMHRAVLLLVVCVSGQMHARRSLSKVSVDAARPVSDVAKGPDPSIKLASLLLTFGSSPTLSGSARSRNIASRRSVSPFASGILPDISSSMVVAASAGGLSSTADELAGAFFGASLFPWLAMLYWMKHPTVQAPSGVTFGLTFLLAFVFGSIPAAIGAGSLYGVSLADADWLHGAAESLLALTNCIVVLGFRDGLSSETASWTRDDRLRSAATILGLCSILSAVVPFVSAADVHTAWLGGFGNLPTESYASEPANALSIPTWIIHTSSLVEWLVAMGLAWRYAEISNQPKWKGVTWGMLPLHTSGIIACTYHLFYNAPAVSWCVTLQAFMTCVGNTTLMLACLRLALAQGWTWDIGKNDAENLLSDLLKYLSSNKGDALFDDVTRDEGSRETFKSNDATTKLATESNDGNSALVGWEDLGDAWSKDSNVFFLLKLATLSGGLAYFVKYAPALLPNFVIDTWAGLPDEVISAFALGVIFLPTGLNVAKWQQRSEEGAEFVGDI